MAEVKWTGEQRKVIELRDRNLLVSAAAGSGKTAVLVERIIARITKGERPLDIDRLLVVTFTKAAAAEMRERIGEAIEQRL
ncbi:MAG TPA: UvrD-helicase domain-containing protein, partial [Candidatus Caccomorpha excrementavium]|nr:UvrD-helicase domain-containing protein [Candidatus Caccomorpha excrementavium]